MYASNKIETFHRAYKCRHRSSRVLIILCLLCAINTALPSVCLAANHYIRDGGIGDGSDWTNAWDDFDDATYIRGDTYYVADGTYTEHTFDTPEDGSSLITIKKATASDHGAENGWQPTYGDGVATIQVTHMNYIRFNTGYWVLDGVTGGGPGSWTSGFGFEIEGQEDDRCGALLLIKAGAVGAVAPGHITITHCKFTHPKKTLVYPGDGQQFAEDWTMEGIYHSIEFGIPIGSRRGLGPHNVTISYCYFYEMTHFVRLGWSTDTIIEYCYFEFNYSSDDGHLPATLNQTEAIMDGGSDDYTVRYNIFKNCQGSAIIGPKGNTVGQEGDRWKIYGNVFYWGPEVQSWDKTNFWSGTGNGAIAYVNSYVVENSMSDCEVYNNSFINLTHDNSVRTGVNFYGNGSGNLVYNNIWYNCKGVNSTSGTTLGWNIYSDCSLSSLTPAATDEVTSGDLFIDWQNEDSTLLAATAAGLTLPDPYDKSYVHDTNTIITRGAADGVWDRGAIEYVSGSPDTTPPLPPTNLISTAQTENSISLSWTAPGPASDGDLASAYKIYRNGTLVDTITNTSFQNTSLAAGTSYNYEIYSVDDAGNKSTSAATGTFSTSADTTPPVISNVQASNVTTSQATITWSTDEASTSQVEYGPDTNYGNSTTLNASLVTSHSVALTGLSASTTYHFRVKSRDSSENESISQDNTFTTISGVTVHTLTISSTSGGTVTDPGEDIFSYGQGSVVSIEAEAADNYDFMNWTGTAVDAGKVVNPNIESTTVTVDSDYTIQANFSLDEVDGTDPTVTNLSPLADSIQTPLNTLITLDITDAGDGVDANTVTIEVNNNTIYMGNTDKYSSASGDCYRTGTNANYRFVYQSEQNFDFDQTINVTVEATDLAGNEMTEYSYSFTTDMRSFGDNIKVNSNTLSSNGMPVTVRDSGGNIWTAWHTGTTGSRDICIGKLTVEAESFSNITKIRDNSIDQCNPAMAVGSDDTLYVAWQDNRNGNWDIYISTSSDWSVETKVTDSNDNQINPSIVVDSSNNAYIVWEDDRNGNGNQDIYIATSSDGFVPKQITTDISDQNEPAIAADSDNTIYVVWTDTRNSKNDIYGAASNNGPWTNVAIVNNANNQSSPAIATESEGSILHLLWVDNTLGDNDIFYDKTTGGLSPLTGSSIINEPGEDQLWPVIAVVGNTTDSNLHVFACWQDERDADDDLYLVEIDDLFLAKISSGDGVNVFVGDNSTNTDQTEPAIGIDRHGHPYLVWTDSRNTNTDIYYAGSTYIEPDTLASADVSISAGATVGTNPASSIDDVSVVVPAGAYPCDITITISKINNPLAFTMQCLGAYDFGPSNIEFTQPVTVTIPYNFTGTEDVALAYWYNSLTDELSQQGITDVTTITVSSSVHALRFNTTHFTPFYVFLGSAAASSIAGGGGGGGGCSMSPYSQASVVELLLPYIGLTVAMVALKLRDRRKRKARNITKSGC